MSLTGDGEQDPDYIQPKLCNTMQQKVHEQTARHCMTNKIKNIIDVQFSREIGLKENEMIQVQKRLHEALKTLQLLRYAVITHFYGSKKVLNFASVKQFRTHPEIKELIGKKPKEMSNYFISTISVRTFKQHYITKKGIAQQNNAFDKHKENQSCKILPRHLPLKSLFSRPSSPPRGIYHKCKKSIVIGNVSKWIPLEWRESDASHKWIVYVRDISGSADISEYIKKVRFFLHPSYRPCDVVELASPPFQLSRRGWGEFPLRIQIHFTNSVNKPMDIIHNLKLDDTCTGLQTLGSEAIVDFWIQHPRTYHLLSPKSSIHKQFELKLKGKEISTAEQEEKQVENEYNSQLSMILAQVNGEITENKNWGPYHIYNEHNYVRWNDLITHFHKNNTTYIQCPFIVSNEYSGAISADSAPINSVPAPVLAGKGELSIQNIKAGSLNSCNSFSAIISKHVDCKNASIQKLVETNLTKRIPIKKLISPSFNAITKHVAEMPHKVLTEYAQSDYTLKRCQIFPKIVAGKVKEYDHNSQRAQTSINSHGSRSSFNTLNRRLKITSNIAQLKTTNSFIKKMAGYDDLHILQYGITNELLKAEEQEITGGVVKCNAENSSYSNINSKRVIDNLQMTNFLSLIKFLIDRVPLIPEDLKYRQLHHRNKSENQYLSFNLGKQKAYERKRAKIIYSQLKKKRFDNENVWTIKEIILWARRFAYTPSINVSNIFDIPLKKNVLKFQNVLSTTSTCTTSNELYEWLSEMKSIQVHENNDFKYLEYYNTANGHLQASIDISRASTNENKSKTATISSEFDSTYIFVHDTTRRIGIKFIPGLGDCFTTTVIAKATNCFLSDLLRLSHATVLDRLHCDRWSSNIMTEQDVRQGLLKREEFDIFTNVGLGKVANNIP